MLKFKAVSYREVYVRDLDNYCEEVYGRNPKLENAEGWGEDGLRIACAVTGEMSKEDAADWMQYMFCGYERHVLNIDDTLEALVTDGHLEAGNYLVHAW